MDDKRLTQLMAAIARRPGSAGAASEGRMTALDSATQAPASRRGSSGTKTPDQLGALATETRRKPRHAGSAE